jgi:hypothetical protein
MSVITEIWPASFLIIDMLILLWTVAGAYYFIHYSGRIFNFIRLRGDVKPQPLVEPQHNIQHTGFICARCGSPNAKYEDHTLICMSCGYKDQP